MKRILGISFLLSILPLLASAAAIEPTAADQMAHNATSCGEYQTPLRLQIISKLYPKLIRFLLDCKIDSLLREIPVFKPGFKFLFEICDKTSTLIIILNKNFSEGIESEIIIWDLKENKLLRHIKRLPYTIVSVLITPNGKKFITRSGTGDLHHEGGVRIWNINGDVSHNLYNNTLIALNHDGSRLLTVSLYEHTFEVWDVESGKRLYSHPNLESPWGNISPTCYALSPDGTRVAFIYDNYNYYAPLKAAIVVFDFLAQTTSWEIQHIDYFDSLDYSPDGTQLIAGIYHRTQDDDIKRSIGVWDVLTGDQISMEELGGDVYKYVRANRWLESYLISRRRCIMKNNIFDKGTLQLLCSEDVWPDYSFTDHWLAWRNNDDNIYSLDLEQLAAFQHDIASLSDLQLELIDRIRQEAEYNLKLILNRKGRRLVRIIKAYDSLPNSIKDLMQYYVAWIIK